MGKQELKKLVDQVSIPVNLGASIAGTSIIQTQMALQETFDNTVEKLLEEGFPEELIDHYFDYCFNQSCDEPETNFLEYMDKQFFSDGID